MIELLDVGKPQSFRLQRVSEEIRGVLSQILLKGDWDFDTKDSCPVTITNVRVSPDLKLATVHIMPLGAACANGLIERLHKNKGYIRKSIAKCIHLKFTPDLRFLPDKSVDHTMMISQLIREEQGKKQQA